MELSRHRKRGRRSIIKGSEAGRYLKWAGLWVKVLGEEARGDWDCLTHSSHLPSSSALGLELAQTFHCPGVSAGSHSPQAWLCPTSAYTTIRLCQVSQAQAIAPPCGSGQLTRPWGGQTTYPQGQGVRGGVAGRTVPIQASAGKEAAGAVVAGDLQTGRHQLSPLSGCARLPFGDAQRCFWRESSAGWGLGAQWTPSFCFSSSRRPPLTAQQLGVLPPLYSFAHFGTRP